MILLNNKLIVKGIMVNVKNKNKQILGPAKPRKNSWRIVAIILAVLLVVTLACGAWMIASGKFGDDNKTSNNSKDDKEDSVNSNPYKNWKTYTSKLDSGLTFRYPGDWIIINSDSFTNNTGGKMASFALVSKKPDTQTVDGAPLSSNIYMCITVNEYSGEWAWGPSDEAIQGINTEESFMTKSGRALYLINHSVQTGSGSNDGLASSVLSVTDGAKTEYITNNGVRFIVEARFNCIQGDYVTTEKSNDKFDERPETAVAKQILMSVDF